MKKYVDESQNHIIYIVSPTESIITSRGKRHPNFALYLVDKGFSVNYISSTFNHAEKRVFSDNELRRGMGISKYPIKFISAGFYKKNISILRVFWNWTFSIKVLIYLVRHVKSSDVVIFPSRPSELLLTSFFIKKIKDPKLILDVEDIWPDAFVVQNSFVRNAFYRYCNFFNKLAIKYFSQAVYVSPNFLSWIRRYSISIPSRLAPLGISDVELHSESRRFYVGKLDSLTLFYGGTLTLQFDIMPILKAIVLSDLDINLVLAGDNGDGERFQDVMEYIEDKSISCVNYGIISKDKFLEVIKNCDIAIVPMVSGGLPKKFFDAVGSYKPILCLGGGGAADEVVKYGLGWSFNFDQVEIKEFFDSLSSECMNKTIESIDCNIFRYLEESSMENILETISEVKSWNN